MDVNLQEDGTVRFSLCYADDDLELAEQVGDSIHRAIEERTGERIFQTSINKSEVVILIISEHTAKDAEVIREAGLARAAGKKILPLIVDKIAVGAFAHVIDSRVYGGPRLPDLDRQMVGILQSLARMMSAG